MRHLLLPLLFVAACGGGSGGDDGPPPPPPPPYAQTTASGLAVGANFADAAALAPLVLVAVSEAEMGADLNGDGDLTDDVLHQIDASTDVATNLGLAVVGRIVASDRHFAFLVREASQNATDLDGDGDAADAVWFVYDPSRGVSPINPLNIGFAAPSTGLPAAGTAGGFVLLESEAAARADRNGDGDQLDVVPRAFDGAVFAASALPLPAHAAGTPLVARNGRVLYAASEASQGALLNGDGDPNDIVLFAVTFTTGVPARVPVGSGFPRAVANHPFALTAGQAVYFIDEAGENALDLNLDGDATDAILAVCDLATGGGETTPNTPTIPSLAVAGAPTVGIGAGSARALVAVSEAGQRRDLNNDFDQVDSILAWVDTTAPTTLHLFPSLALVARTPLIDGTRGLVVVSEAASGFSGTDFNADGDTSDPVAFLVDTASSPGATTNLSIAVASYALDGLDAFLGLDEAAQGNADRNANGTRTDVLQYYLDLGDPAPAPRGLGIVAASLAFFRLSPQEVRIAAILPEGQSASFFDLNLDGDSTDAGLALFALDPEMSPPGVIAPTPFFAGTAAAGSAPALRTAADTFVFPTSEAMAGEDLNADGDQDDTVLCTTRIQ